MWEKLFYKIGVNSEVLLSYNKNVRYGKKEAME